MNWKDIKKLIRKELNEATTVDAGGSKLARLLIIHLKRLLI